MYLIVRAKLKKQGGIEVIGQYQNINDAKKEFDKYLKKYNETIYKTDIDLNNIIDADISFNYTFKNTNYCLKLICIDAPDNNCNKTIYETIKFDRDKTIVVDNHDIHKRNSFYREFWKITPGDFLIIETEKIAPSGYAYSGTKKVLMEIDLKTLKCYNQLIKNGWNNNAVKIIKKEIE